MQGVIVLSGKGDGVKKLQLQNAISNFLKFMAFVKTASPLTLRAYWVDLSQAFDLPREALVEGAGPVGTKDFNIEGRLFRSAGPSFTEKELLNRARDAMNGWGRLSLASRNRKAATLKSFFGWCYQESLTESDLSTRVHCPKVPRKLPHFLSVDEIISITKSFDEDDSIEEQALFYLLYGGGLRISEACGLEWKRVSGRQIRVLGKGSKERIVPLPDIVVKILKELRAQQAPKTPYVFGSEPLDTRKAFTWIRRRGEKAKLMKLLHPHALRHSYATHLLSGGANLRSLQELLGHDSLRATEKYTHLGMDQLARMMEKTHPLGKKAR